jgi:NADH-quinone oxidoreductase subunit L
MGAIMAVIVAVLATLVLVYNAWYMHGDGLAARFPWQFCLFAFAMLTVVLADNLLMAFIGWELVGLGSYLLIGFWSAKPAASADPEYQRLKGAGARGVLEHRLSPAHAQLKAFVMNRVGDAGFLIGIGAFLAAGLAAGFREPLTWASLAQLAEGGVLPGSFLGLSGGDLLTLACLGVFCGAVGKSAQFPLHTWLPDAMQGPTTASSIIHAATMVAAGVFLVARLYPVFTPDALAVAGWIGGITCLLAASIACVQWDLKAVLAYSTVSQLGLMFVALGSGAAAGGLQAGIGHLFTHALFKNLLFLCAGAVIHACAGCQDLHRMGGLARRMPLTAIASGLGVLAIIGMPFFSGFWSKDAVLAAALLHGQEAGGAAWGPFLLACAGSLLTAAYMVRWWIRIFAGPERDHAVCHHAHVRGRRARPAHALHLHVRVELVARPRPRRAAWRRARRRPPPRHGGGRRPARRRRRLRRRGLLVAHRHRRRAAPPARPAARRLRRAVGHRPPLRPGVHARARRRPRPTHRAPRPRLAGPPRRSRGRRAAARRRPALARRPGRRRRPAVPPDRPDRRGLA